MKKTWFIMVTAMLILCIASPTFAAVTNKYFRADKQTYDPETDLYSISGNIVINLGSGTITGDKAQVKLSTLEFFGTGGWLLQQDGVDPRYSPRAGDSFPAQNIVDSTTFVLTA